MIHEMSIQLRFNDTDAFGHLNNAVFATCAELGRMAFLEELVNFTDNLILANLNIDFVAQIKFKDSVQITTQVQKLGNSSITLYQELKANNQIAAKIQSVVVVFDYETQKSTPISDDVRAKLELYLRSS